MKLEKLTVLLNDRQTLTRVNNCGSDEHSCGEKMKFVDLVGSEMMFVELSELTF